MTSPHDVDPAVARLLQRPPPPVAPARPLWREPIRLAVIVATAAIAVTTNLPWLHQEGTGRILVLTGNSGYADGTLLTVVAIATSILVTNREAAGSRTWLLRWLPAILGVVGLLFVLSAYRNMELQIQIWRRFGATGVYDPGFFAFTTAGLAFALPAIVIGLRRGLAATTDGRANERLRVRRRSVITTIVTAVGLVGGAVIGGAVAIGLDVEPAAVGVPLLGLTVLGGTIGGVAAARLARLLLAP